jgi:glycine/D-amino acid oxidase-like deaminating enzyme
MTAAQPHCSSYYAASRNDHTSYPVLQGEVDADVCVIGGGFTGVSTALTLAERGLRVALVEQHLISWGASGRNGGQMIGGMSGEGRLSKHWGGERDELMWNLGYRGHDIIAERIEKYAIECDFKRGYIDVSLKPRQLDDLKEWHQEHVDHGMDDSVRLVDAEEVSSLLGTSAYLGGLINTHNGHLHPLNLCLGEARAAASLGARIFEGSEVIKIEHGRRPRVVCTHGAVTADFVVLAGNAYHRLEQKKLKGRLFPAGSYIIATEPLSEEEAKEINGLDMAVCDQNNVLDYYRLSADRRMLFGGRCNYSGRDPKDIAGSMVPRLHNIYPQLKDKRIDYAWGGSMGIILNRVPMMGRTAPNVLYCQGYSGHGVNMTHVCGEALADAVAGTLESFDFFADVSHFPIPFSQWFGNQAVAAGMLYYRLRDLL